MDSTCDEVHRIPLGWKNTPCEIHPVFGLQAQDVKELHMERISGNYIFDEFIICVFSAKMGVCFSFKPAQKWHSN